MPSDYESLVKRTQEAFGLPPSKKDIKFYYLDEEQELISINSQFDYDEAINIEDFATLKLTVAGSVQEAREEL